jgi:hypothetical protein
MALRSFTQRPKRTGKRSGQQKIMAAAEVSKVNWRLHIVEARCGREPSDADLIEKEVEHR